MWTTQPKLHFINWLFTWRNTDNPAFSRFWYIHTMAHVWRNQATLLPTNIFYNLDKKTAKVVKEIYGFLEQLPTCKMAHQFSNLFSKWQHILLVKRVHKCKTNLDLCGFLKLSEPHPAKDFLVSTSPIVLTPVLFQL